VFEEEDKETGYAVFLAVTLAIVVSLFVIAIAIGSVIGQADSRKSPHRLLKAPSVVLIVAQVRFELGKAEVPRDAEMLLRPAIRAAKAFPASKLVVSGYHDASGDAAANAELAKRRAFAVRDVLMAVGVAEKQIELAKPIVTMGGDDPEEARRVDVTVR